MRLRRLLFRANGVASARMEDVHTVFDFIAIHCRDATTVKQEGTSIRGYQSSGLSHYPSCRASRGAH